MNLSGLLGADVEDVADRLGAPDTDRSLATERWLVFRRDAATVRVRCVAGRVASWTLTWTEARPTLRRAVEPLGLWPACRPDAQARDVEGSLVRRALPAPSADAAHSLTAGIGAEGFVRVAAFDEPPEWG